MFQGDKVCKLKIEKVEKEIVDVEVVIFLVFKKKLVVVEGKDLNE